MATRMNLLGRNRHSRGSGASSSAILSPGTVAPAFTLPDEKGRQVSLDNCRGRPIILVFYPADGSPVCSNQLALYNEALSLFEEHGAQLLGISVDDVESHRKFATELNLRFPLLSDSQPEGEVTRLFGAYNEQTRLSQRALFVIDKEGRISWSHVSPTGINPGAHGILGALETLED